MAGKQSKTQIKANTLLSLVKVMRPIHWVKNLALFAALIFSGTLFLPPYFLSVVWGFIAFSLATSATYTFNDILDAEEDSVHPIKKFRPIASGALSTSVASVAALVLSVLALLFAAKINPLFFLLTLLYLSLQIAYSLFFKNIAIIDILTIASGFIIRVYAGAVIINAHLSVWFLLCVVSVALFLAAGKRRSELNIAKQTDKVTRKSLKKYSRELLSSYVTMFGNAAWMSWSLFTFFESPTADQDLWLILAELSKTTTISKLMMLTIPVVIFGIMRYESLIFEGKSEAPEKILLKDIPLVSSVVLWAGMVIAILYAGVSVQ